jgi:dihydroneopterin aldolase
VTDRILLRNMTFLGTHGVHEEEQRIPQPFEIDVEFGLDLAHAGREDDLGRTIDYGRAFQVCRRIVETTHFRLIEALAETIARDLLAGFPLASEVTVQVRKPRAPIEGTFDWVGVEVHRARG